METIDTFYLAYFLLALGFSFQEELFSNKRLKQEVDKEIEKSKENLDYDSQMIWERIKENPWILYLSVAVIFLFVPLIRLSSIFEKK
jgi:sugar phosphate permease